MESSTAELHKQSTHSFAVTYAYPTSPKTPGSAQCTTCFWGKATTRTQLPTPPATPRPDTFSGARTLENHGCRSRCAHHSPISQQGEPPIQWDFKDTVHKAVTVSVTFSTAPMNTTSQAQGSHQPGHLCLNISVHKLPGQQGKAGNKVSILLAASKPLVLQERAITSTPSPLDTGLARPLPFTTKLEAGPSLTQCNANFHNCIYFISVSQQTSPFAEKIPVFLLQ